MKLTQLPVRHGPVIARVRPGFWIFTNNVLPSGENVAPANSEVFIALFAIPNITPAGVTPRTRFASGPSSHTMMSPQGAIVMLSTFSISILSFRFDEQFY